MSTTVVERHITQGVAGAYANANANANARDFAPLRFLVAEDHEFQRDTITRLLRLLGASAVLGTADGASTLRVLADPQHSIDILVLDLAMPGMDGVELIRQLGEARAGVAVILNSSFDLDFLEGVKMIAQGYGLTVLGAVVKPLTAVKLRLMVEPFLARSRGRCSG